MRVAFAGTPEFAATILRGLLDSEHDVGLVISQPNARRGRGRKAAQPPVAKLAASENLELLQPGRIGDVAEEISAHEVLVVAAYGQILRSDTLYAAPHGAFNVHASLLPKYRGAAPIERAIMAGETETGVSIMKMDEGLDTGPVALRKSLPVSPDSTGGEITDLLARLGAKALVEVLALLESGELNLEAQDSSSASYADKLTPENRIIRWTENAKVVHDLIRALSPHIGARTFHPDFEGPVKILRSGVVYGRDRSLAPGDIWTSDDRIFVVCGKNAIEILELQLPGGRPLDAESFLRGRGLAGSFTS